ncbi:MAG: hypothetical protein AB7E61_04080 [Acholeplasmataceae bacterium]
MKNIVIINWIGILYSIVASVVTLIFFNDYTSWVILGAVTALFNHSLLIRFTKTKIIKEVVYLLIAFKFVIYLIVLGFMFFLLREDSDILMKSYIFFLVGAINIKFGIMFFHLPFKKFKSLREEEKKLKEGEDLDTDIS